MSPNPALPAEITIYTVGALHRGWRSWFADIPDRPKAARVRKARAGAARARRAATPAAADDRGWHVDASAVAEIDAAGLQLLLALAQSLALRGRALRLDAPSAPLTTACESLGVATLLAPPPVPGSAA